MSKQAKVKTVNKSTSPKNIKTILDYALKARDMNLHFVPLFTGEAGLGKSFICQQWVKDQQELDENFGFLDLRIAYHEGPDLIGFPFVFKDSTGKERQLNALPDMWPTSGRGLLLIEEPNRGNQMVMNCLMQILTDRKIGQYTLPKGWIIASCINPEQGYDVNTMDPALKNRFAEFEITYDHSAFMEYAKAVPLHSNVLSFLNSNYWTYSKSEQIGTGENSKEKYISPRTWKMLSDIEQTNIMENKELHYVVACANLGDGIGNAYHNFIFEQSPVLAKDLIDNKKVALEKLEKQADRDAYRGDLISATTQSIESMFPNFPLGTVIDVVKIIPLDQGIQLLQKYVDMHPDQNYNLEHIIAEYPDLKETIKNTTKRSNHRELFPELYKDEKK